MDQLPHNYPQGELPTRLLILHTCTFSAIHRKRQGNGNTEKPIFAKGNSSIASNHRK